MANVKISDLTDGDPIAAGDLVEIERPGAPAVSRKATLGTAAGAAIAAFAAAVHTHAVADLSDASANGRSLIAAANYAAMRVLLDLEAGTDFYSIAAADAAFAAAVHTHTVAQLSDASANGRSLISAADYTAMAALLESAIEAAIDSLANLVSIQGHTVTLTGAFIRSGAHSLTLTTAATTNVTLPASGTLAALDVEDQTLAGGARVTVKDLGNLSGNTITPDPGDRPIQKITNNGAGTIAPGSNVGCYLLVVKNTTGAGAITTSGWQDVSGEAFDTTTTSEFLCHCTVTGDLSAMVVNKVA